MIGRREAEALRRARAAPGTTEFATGSPPRRNQIGAAQHPAGIQARIGRVHVDVLVPLKAPLKVRASVMICESPEAAD